MKIDTWKCLLEYSPKCTRDNPIHGDHSGCGHEGYLTKCDMPGCKEEHGRDRWSWKIAYAKGWYHKKNLDYCPMHIPPRLLAERRDAQIAIRNRRLGT
jgi:hypothetical protein